MRVLEGWAREKGVWTRWRTSLRALFGCAHTPEQSAPQNTGRSLFGRLGPEKKGRGWNPARNLGHSSRLTQRPIRASTPLTISVIPYVRRIGVFFAASS
jgi:hypothetical protein